MYEYYFTTYVITVISTGTSSFHDIIDKNKPNFNATQRESVSYGNYYINLFYSYKFLEKPFHCLSLLT